MGGGNSGEFYRVLRNPPLRKEIEKSLIYFILEKSEIVMLQWQRLSHPQRTSTYSPNAKMQRGERKRENGERKRENGERKRENARTR